MMLEVYGFDWGAYGGVVMPGFTRWLVEGEESDVYQLYQDTRCAREEQHIPPMLCPVRTWTRAQALVQRLPRGAHIQEEYKILCDAEQFTLLSDQYTYRHIPQLYPQAEALRAVWGAIVGQHCQSCFVLPDICLHSKEREALAPRGAFLNAYGYEAEGGKAVGCGASPRQRPHRLSQAVQEHDGEDMGGDTEKLGNDDEGGGGEEVARGVRLGRHPAALHLRGWLAACSVRAMALFELLACGRRAMPFGYRAGEPYEDYCGYLTPVEVAHLAECLRNERAPVVGEADYGRSDRGLYGRDGEFRLIDEVLPVHADALLSVVRMAAQYDLGLLCRVS